jgi:hypothetical protein
VEAEGSYVGRLFAYQGRSHRNSRQMNQFYRFQSKLLTIKGEKCPFRVHLSRSFETMASNVSNSDETKMTRVVGLYDA